MSDLPVTELLIEDWGLLAYEVALQRQQEKQQARLVGDIIDTLVFVEHPPVVTLGRRGSGNDLKLAEEEIPAVGVALQSINRGGLATAHEPGQLVVYPILALKRKDVRWYANTFLQVVIMVLAEYGLTGNQKEGEPGVWVNDRKICSFGIGIRKWVTSHGIALNVNNSLKTFDLIVPCGRPDEKITSLAQELGRPIDPDQIRQYFVDHFLAAFAYFRKDR